MNQYVYAIRCTGTPYVKIGLTRDVERRLGQLQQANPHKLEFICCRTPAAYHLEGRIRALLPAQRGEWVRAQDDDMVIQAFRSIPPGNILLEIPKVEHRPRIDRTKTYLHPQFGLCYFGSTTPVAP